MASCTIRQWLHAFNNVPTCVRAQHMGGPASPRSMQLLGFRVFRQTMRRTRRRARHGAYDGGTTRRLARRGSERGWVRSDGRNSGRGGWQWAQPAARWKNAATCWDMSFQHAALNGRQLNGCTILSFFFFKIKRCPLKAISIRWQISFSSKYLMMIRWRIF